MIPGCGTSKMDPQTETPAALQVPQLTPGPQTKTLNKDPNRVSSICSYSSAYYTGCFYRVLCTYPPYGVVLCRSITIATTDIQNIRHASSSIPSFAAAEMPQNLQAIYQRTEVPIWLCLHEARGLICSIGLSRADFKSRLAQFELLVKEEGRLRLGRVSLYLRCSACDSVEKVHGAHGSSERAIQRALDRYINIAPMVDR
ncbi:uncharacterized protein BDV17DRAFT_190856 [Aspergillus undulatus]|uniref:uncharacterized protein n=1 Tax=Aspergillus undulatus TaxID=1810928 RepID=UPI003CCDEEA8